MATSDKSADEAAPANDAQPAETEEAPVTASTKSAMAAALERKNAANAARGGHLDGHAKVGDATENHKATRTFRRKSG
ncbi:DUF5302 domain-containing protein [Nakamurella lactea]|uniref:DUF5302 domain-containing protein n=1 Tax=Nakamurella lactea TaxID=459515 RepID=UPI0003FE488E|nr:DUF5302 domain-containing protein [Nakamurella lactea]